MADGHTAYDYGGVDTDAGLAEDGHDERDLDLVVVEGRAMHYRDYCQDGGDEKG